jgi:hypothetical protein
MMKTLLKATVLLGVVATMSPAVLAQWAPHPTPNVPKSANGEPNLTGPAPRTADGKPDLSGIWQNGGGGGGNRGQRGAANAAGGQGQGRGAGANAPDGQGRGGAANTAGGQGRGGGNAPAAAPATTPPANPIPLATFGNVGSGFPEGLPFQPWAADLVKKRQADNSKDNPDAHCLPMGFMQFHTHPQPRKIIQTPEVTMIIYEANSGLRQIFTDGRALPGPDAEPWWYGYSIGKWEGDTLVVETRNIRDGEWLDVRGSTLTSSAKVIEKFRRPNYGTLEIEITIDDPKAYTKPWTVRINQRVMLNTELIEFICEERDATHYVGATPAPAK